MQDTRPHADYTHTEVMQKLIAANWTWHMQNFAFDIRVLSVNMRAFFKKKEKK